MKKKKIIHKGDLKEIKLIKSYQLKRKEISKPLNNKFKIIFTSFLTNI